MKIANNLYFNSKEINMEIGGVSGFYLVYLLLGVSFIGSILVWKYSHP